VPLLIRWPGVTRDGAKSELPVTTPDLFATIAAICGARPGATIDGRPLVAELRGRKMKPAPIYWHYPHYSNQGGVPGGAIRDGEWKLIEFYEDGRVELFHLPSDPGERVNLAKREAGRAGRMRARLAAWRKAVNAVMPQPNPAYDPATENQGLTGAEKPTPPA
jgi:arylsulfatase A-like enzyme